MQFELEVGRTDLAAKYLNQMLNKKPAFEDKDWVALEQQVGDAAFLRLRLILRWSDDLKIDNQARKDADQLSTTVNTARKNILGNPDTIRRYLKQLSGDREDRIYATTNLQRAGTDAIPTLLAELHTAKGEDHDILMALLPRLEPKTLLPLIAALDVNDTDLRLDLMDVLMQPRSRDTQPYLQKAVPTLWYLAGSPKVPERVREKAKEVLARLTHADRAKLPAPATALTREAESYYNHAVPMENTVHVWRWDEKQGQPVEGLVTPSLAEEYYGLRAARQALEIDPTYVPAQQVLLGLLLEKAAERAGGVDLPPPHDLRELLATVNPELINRLLEQSLTDHRVSVALGAIRALGDLAEIRALKPTGHGEPALVRALSYPNRRIQFAAAERCCASRQRRLRPLPGASSMCCAAMPPSIRSRRPAGRCCCSVSPTPPAPRPLLGRREAGFDVEKVPTGRAALERLQKSADVDAILIGTELPDPGLTPLLGQLRDDPSFGAVPLWLVTPWDTQESLKIRQAEVEIQLRTFRKDRQSLIEERRRVESLYLKSKGGTAAVYKDRLDRIDRELQGEWFALTARSLTALAKEDVPEAVLSKLKNLNNKEFPSQASFQSELNKVLSKQDLARYQQRVLEQAPQGFSQERENRILAEQKTLDRQLLSAPPARDAVLRRLLAHYRHTWVLPELSASDKVYLQQVLAQPLADVHGLPLTPAESKTYAEHSLEWLARMARGEITGYDFTPAEPALYKALQTPALGEKALEAVIEATGRLPAGRGGDKPQMELASIVLGTRPVPVRQAAAAELLRRIQRTSPVLSRMEVQRLEELRGSDHRRKAARGGGAADWSHAARCSVDRRAAPEVRAQTTGTAAAAQRRG